MPQVGDPIWAKDLQEAADYYLTPRGQAPTAPNKFLTESLSYMVAFHGFDLVEPFLTQPLLVIAGSKAESLWHSAGALRQSAGPKELVEIDGATHMDLYDHRVHEVVSHLSPFFVGNLGEARQAELATSAESR